MMTAASALSGLNVVLLIALLVVWGRNYRTFRTRLTLGLIGFALVLLVENAVALFFFFDMGMLYAGSTAAQSTVLAMRALQCVALSSLTVVTVR